MTTLPGVLSKLASGELGDFPAVRAHQLQPWSMFLTQLAAIALHRAGKTDPKISEDAWREGLLALTAGKHEPWALVVDDLRQPAFFQPPVPEGDIGRWKGLAECPDEIDILVTSKAHDVKTPRIFGAGPEHWVYALATLQTTQGYPGPGYYGIARMKGGYGNRPRVGLSADQSVAARFRRDASVLLEVWPSLLARGFQESGVSLVWLEPWDGTRSLALSELAPHFIEICQRVRCRLSADRLILDYTTSSSRRCLPEIENGDVGDPWIPVERDGGALTVGARGFHYDLMTNLLLGADFAPPPAQDVRKDDPDPVLLLATALARGQGKTDRLHERTLLLSGELQRRLGLPDQRADLGRRATGQVIAAKTMRSKVLIPAIKALALGQETIKDAFDERVDETFFRELFAGLSEDIASAKLRWEMHLNGLAEKEFRLAIERSCLADARRYRVISKAEGLFHGCLRKNFPDLFEVAKETRTVN